MSYPPQDSSAKPSNPTSPTRPKHLTTRSISEVHHKHHHPHLHHHRRKEEPQSVHQSQPALGSYDGTSSRSEGFTPNQSRDVSRRGSMLVVDIPEGNGKEKRVVKEGEVREEREKGILRAAELRNALLGLNTLSNNTTRRLDNTYYSVLEKLSTLQNTISSLKELANMTRKLNDDFIVESEEVVTDINTQLAQFSHFDDQQARIEALASRVQAGRQRIKTLGSRVDIVQDRVTCWELAEKEWKDKTRKRLRIMWTVIFVFLFIFVGLMVFQSYTPVKTQGASPFKGMNTSGLLGKVPDMQGMENETWTLKRKTEDKLDELRKHSQGPLEEDPRLRIFDEL
ncbi:hypothetical protein N431DRAFT_406448 [Stipitochalara longipes BDJ]|nr:hypothetical protein N431DRAFT_406448 [Stipitochalara longipes BDJ]